MNTRRAEGVGWVVQQAAGTGGAGGGGGKLASRNFPVVGVAKKLEDTNV